MWSSKKQPVVVLSMIEAEYVAAAHATKEVIWLHALTGELTTLPSILTIIQCDNQSTISLSKDSQHHAKTKHIDIASTLYMKQSKTRPSPLFTSLQDP